MEKKLNVGIAGVSTEKGWAAAAHLPSLQKLEGYKVTAISHHQKEKAAAAAKQLDIPFAFSNNRDLFAHSDLDLAVVTVKVPQHHELITEAIAEGRNVFSEWPLAMTLAEAEELNDLANRAGVRGFVGLQSRSVPAVLYVRDLIRNGAIGEVLSSSMIGSGIYYGPAHHAASAYAVDAANGAGMINVTFANAIDALCFVLGEFAELSATAATRRETTTIIETGESIPMSVYDQVAVTGTLYPQAASNPGDPAANIPPKNLAGGPVVSVHFRGGVSHATNFYWEINGTAGDIVITAPGGHLGVFPVTVRMAQAGDPELKELAVPAKYLRVPAGNELSLVAQNVGQNYALIESDLRHNTHLAPSFADAVTRQRMVAAIEKAALTGCKQRYSTTFNLAG